MVCTGKHKLLEKYLDIAHGILGLQLSSVTRGIHSSLLDMKAEVCMYHIQACTVPS